MKLNRMWGGQDLSWYEMFVHKIKQKGCTKIIYM